MMGRQHIAEYLRKAAEAGEVEINDFELAADQFRIVQSNAMATGGFWNSQ